MKVSKRLTTKNGLTIPKAVRLDVGFMPGMAVDIEVVPGGVFIRKHVPICKFCGNAEEVSTVRNMDICSDCAASLGKELEAVFDGNI